ncbi:hypothetical protein D9758_011972 [Tetrapyrgos nigripes]|uniref:MYND-type domain-containing protein n=1 Tax=Tetrapyrgos nigripes TaxID=182062 RepID=A0A8H5D2C0_9AGAR|nr:hypothetical protein D9758_011972 [Tetrapyrgos nigripes]
MNSNDTDTDTNDLPIAFIRGFVFCSEHGSEFCSKCMMDQRLNNNQNIMGALKKAFPDKKGDFADRPPIATAFSICTRSKTHKSPMFGDFLFECNPHKVPECPACFDWEKIVISQMKLVYSSKNPNAIPVVLSRDDKLGLLASMGVDLPPKTRLPDLDLERRLEKGIDKAQGFEKLIGEGHGNRKAYDPSRLSKWPSSKSLLNGMTTSSLAEALHNAAKGSREPELYKNPFTDTRQSLMGLGNAWDHKPRMSCHIFEDKEEEHGICMRVVDVFMLPNDIPLIVVLYLRGLRSYPPTCSIKWVQDLQETKEIFGMPKIHATEAEQNLLLTILERNSERLSPDYRPKRRSNEKDFTLSFLLPLAPLSQQNIMELSTITGCGMCGDETTSRCSGCLAVEYCGTICQKADWKTHKSMCNSLKSGKNLHLVTMNHRSKPSVDNATITSSLDPAATGTASSTAIPSNIYGSKPFLIKIQRQVTPPGMNVNNLKNNPNSTMMIYDEQRTANFWLINGDDKEAFGTALEETKTGPRGLKVYRWAKRVGDLELSVCIDKGPVRDPQW